MAYKFNSELELIKLEEESNSNVEEVKTYSLDKYDALVSTGVGVISGLMDIFLVGVPTTKKNDRSILTKWSDEQTDEFIKKFSRKMGWDPRTGQEENVRSAIGFLEKKFKVNYDQRHSKDVDNLFRMSTKDHHLKSLSHSPDLMGLFFSVINQFTNTSTFISDGQLITVNTETFELYGSDLLSKLFAAFVNWFGHIVSDVGGSSGTLQRGSGIAMPFYSLTQFLNFGKLNVGKDKQTLAEIANRAFREGYDFRHGAATAIPVLFTEICIRFFWSLRAYFQYDFTLKESIPRIKGNDSLRRMLIFGHGTLSLLDGTNAVIKGGGNYLIITTHLNFIAWFRLSLLVFKEISVQFDMNLYTLDEISEIYEDIHDSIKNQLEWLKTSNIEQFNYETSLYNDTVEILEMDLDEEEFNHALLYIYKKIGIELPWEGDFDSYILSKKPLKFKRKED